MWDWNKIDNQPATGRISLRMSTQCSSNRCDNKLKLEFGVVEGFV
jgi:hypothetical protein